MQLFVNVLVNNEGPTPRPGQMFLEIHEPRGPRITVPITPKQARDLAKHLLTCANDVDTGQMPGPDRIR
jgi:hypothetical protein